MLKDFTDKHNSTTERVREFFDNLFFFIRRIPTLTKRAFIIGMRVMEYWFTGESDYKIHTFYGADFDLVNDKYKANLLKEKVEIYLRRNFGIQLRRPVIVELYSGNQLNLKGIIMELNGNLGSYYYENLGKSGIAHMIYLREGMSRKKFMSVLAHEMTHAFIREEKLMNCDRYLREGFARWVEYNFLLEAGLPEEAEKIKKIKTYRHGKAVEKLFKLEKKVGKDRVMEIIRKID